MSLFFIVLGFILLVVGGEFLVRASVALSFRLQISKMVIGLTVVSFATSLPELIVSMQAAIDGYSDIALGNVIGSNIANIGLVLGITAIIAPLAVDKDFYKINWPVMTLLSIALFYIVKSELIIDRLEGTVLIAVLLIYMWVLISRAKKTPIPTNEEDGIDAGLSYVSYFKITIWLIIGGLALWGGSEFLVSGAVDFAVFLGVSQRIIAVTMIAIGTSVPELAASVMAALKKEKALSLGNLIGSNIFNISSVLGITALIQPIEIKNTLILNNDIYWMLGFAMVLLPIVFIPKRFIIGRFKGLFIFTAYIVFIMLTFVG